MLNLKSSRLPIGNFSTFNCLLLIFFHFLGIVFELVVLPFKTYKMKHTLILLTIVASLSLNAQVIKKEIFWPESISFANIVFPNQYVSQYQYDTAHPCQKLTKVYYPPKVLGVDKISEELPVIHTGPTVATVIEYYEKYNTFYIRFDCRMGHGDYAYGPFSGDPKVVLNPKM